MPLSINPMLFLKTGFLAFWLIFEEVLLVAATNTAETLKDCSPFRYERFGSKYMLKLDF
jgi:hypothetical protein